MQRKIQEKILRVALYVRVSTEEQALHGASLDAQEESLLEYARANNMKVVKVYRDEGISGSLPAMKRPAMSEMVADIKADKIDMIIMTKLDRYFRNVKEYFKLQDILDQHNVQWKTTQEEYDTVSANGQMAITMFLAIAQAERQRTAERVRFVFESKRRRKELAFGGGVKPYGYTVEEIDGVKRLVKDPETEHIVTEFWDHVRKYNSVRLAGLYCNEKYGLKRRYKTWTDMSRQELYTGTYKGVVDYCPAYIPRDEWEYLMQSHVMIKTTRNPERVYLFTGLFRCPSCGATLKASFTRRDGNEWRIYRCNNGQLGMCEYKKSVSEKKSEKYLLANIEQALSDYILSVESSPLPKKTKSAAKDLVKLSEQLRRLNTIYMAGNLEDDEYIKQTNDIKKKMDEARKAEQDGRPPDLEVLKQIASTDFVEIYKTLEPEDKRRMWRSIISEIHVDGNNIKEIIFRA